MDFKWIPNVFALKGLNDKFQIGTSSTLGGSDETNAHASCSPLVRHPTEQQSAQIELNKQEEVAVITFADELEIGAGQLKLEFTGEINDLLKGCYRAKYTTADGEERYGLSTKFESVYCRRAFPCW